MKHEIKLSAHDIRSILHEWAMKTYPQLTQGKAVTVSGEPPDGITINIREREEPVVPSGGRYKD
jgi:hypothetical protein